MSDKSNTKPTMQSCMIDSLLTGGWVGYEDMQEEMRAQGLDIRPTHWTGGTAGARLYEIRNGWSNPNTDAILRKFQIVDSKLSGQRKQYRLEKIDIDIPDTKVEFDIHSLRAYVETFGVCKVKTSHGMSAIRLINREKHDD